MNKAHALKYQKCIGGDGGWAVVWVARAGLALKGQKANLALQISNPLSNSFPPVLINLFFVIVNTKNSIVILLSFRPVTTILYIIRNKLLNIYPFLCVWSRFATLVLQIFIWKHYDLLYGSLHVCSRSDFFVVIRENDLENLPY